MSTPSRISFLRSFPGPFISGFSGILGSMKLRSRAKETLDDVSHASKKVVETTEFATIALIAVAGVSILALIIAIRALNKAGEKNE